MTMKSIKHECYYCLEVFRLKDPCVVHCSESNPIHEKCLRAWLAKAPTCPLCRAKIQIDSCKVQTYESLTELTSRPIQTRKLDEDRSFWQSMIDSIYSIFQSIKDFLSEIFS